MNFLCYIKRHINHKYLKPVDRQCNLVVKGLCIGARLKLNSKFTTCQGCDFRQVGNLAHCLTYEVEIITVSISDNLCEDYMS